MLRALFCALYLCFSMVCRGQCVNIYGSITDAYTGKGIANVLITQAMNGTSRPSSKTSPDGSYRITLPCDARGIRVEAEGYRVQSLPVNLLGKPSAAGFYVPVKLVQIDKQASDQPYFQEQQKYVSIAGGAERAQQHATRLFEVTDAISARQINAELCLFYTKSGAKDCRKLIAGQPGYEVAFTKTDIVAIEVKANGYQTYFGNLIVDKLDNQKSKYQIRLSTQLNMTCLTVDAGGQKVQCLLSGQRSVVMSSDGVHFWADIPAKGDYKLIVKGPKDELLHSGTLSASAGLNFFSLILPASKNILKVPARAALPAAESIGTGPRTIYFDKSDYRLRSESKNVLDTIAVWLQANPSGYLNIVGHTDNVGDRHLNRTLSEYRARITYHFLEQAGADIKRITYKGKGDGSPAAPNDIETNKERNRRVVIELLTKQ